MVGGLVHQLSGRRADEQPGRSRGGSDGKRGRSTSHGPLLGSVATDEMLLKGGYSVDVASEPTFANAQELGYLNSLYRT